MGGRGGHISHVYEDMNMSFQSLRDIISSVTSGKIEAIEKVDGQNLYFRYDPTDNQAKFARNETHDKAGGITREAMTADFKKKGERLGSEYDSVIKTFDDGMEVIQRSLSSIPEDTLHKIFYAPDLFVSTEIMSGDNRNIIAYNGNFITMHGMTLPGSVYESDISEDEIQRLDKGSREAFKTLVSAIDRHEYEVSSQNWKVVGPKIVQLTNLSDGDFIERFDNVIDEILEGTDLTLENTFKDFVSFHLASVINQTFQNKVSDEVFLDILNLLTETKEEKQQRLKVGYKITLNALKKKHPFKEDHIPLRNIALSENSKKVLSIILEPFAKVVTQFSSELLSGSQSFFMKDTDEARKMLSDMTSIAMQRIPDVIKTYLETGDVDNGLAAEAEKKQASFDKQMGRMIDVSRISTGIEGVVFEYPPMSRRYYKFTGGFAPANQILGLLDWEGKSEIMSIVQTKYKDGSDINESEFKDLVRMTLLSY